MYDTHKAADRIRGQAKLRGVAVGAMLSDLDLGINALSQFDKGRVMSSFNLARIADYLDCSVDYLLGRTDNPDVNR